MGGKWRKLKVALGMHVCLYVPKTLDDSSSPSSFNLLASRFSDAAVPAISSPSHDTPISSSSSTLSTNTGPRSSQKTCAICLTTIKPGQGHAIFTAECTHSFHFHCITSNVKHGNRICPVCRAKWKYIPFQSPSSHLSSTGIPRFNPAGLPQDNNPMTPLRRLPSSPLILFHGPEATKFDDDELLDHQLEESDISQTYPSGKEPARNRSLGLTIQVKMFPEVSAVPRSKSHKNFTVLVHIKAPLRSQTQNTSEFGQCSRAPVDLVTLLDVSGSMTGTKLALLKRAMGFLIQNLGPRDRLSVISFSSTARRLFPLIRMTESGRNQALQAVNSLVSNGGTNIVEGLRKGAKILADRKSKNPVGSIILLSDGQDTYTVTTPIGTHPQVDYRSLLPKSIHQNNNEWLKIPVHSFGFGSDHDPAPMHSISELSGGTFSFIEAEGSIQDAFAQCIGGLLSVVVQDIQIKIDCIHPSLHMGSIYSGNYQATINEGARTGSINVGDLYAEEERDFLVSIDIPIDSSINEMSLLKVRCVYKDPLTKETTSLFEASEVKIERPDVIRGDAVVSLEVDRQRNRVRAIEVMNEARGLAEHGDLTGAVSLLEKCRRALISETASGRAGDQLCVSLCAEMKELQERMDTRRTYEASGRAYVLSGLSSHSWQRATARGDSTNSGYQTQSMVAMVTKSQTMTFRKPANKRSLQPAQSFPVRNQAR